ncbi:receptor-type tyrosine-protein phosphatase H-like isoform 2-T2 [Spinachia spinachia]
MCEASQKLTAMKPFSFKITSDHFLLCASLSLLWVVADSNTTVAPLGTKSTNTTTVTPTLPTTLTTTKAPPGNVHIVTVKTRNETSITLKWQKVDNISTYFLRYKENSSMEDLIMDTNGGLSVEHVVTPLSAGRKYNFTIVTTSEGANSTGYSLDAVTAPRNAEGLQSGGQTETSITLRWKKVGDHVRYNLVVNGGTMIVSASGEEEYVTHTISNLTSGTRYNFTLFTEFENVTSSGVNYSASTAPRNAEGLQSGGQTETSITLRWKKVGDHVKYNLVVNGGTMIVSASGEEEYVTHTISNLTSGTRYNFTLFTLFDRVSSGGVKYDRVTAPRNVEDLQSVGQTETSITLRWKKVGDHVKYKLVVNGGTMIVSASGEEEYVTHTISNLTSGTRYNFTLFTEFENVTSSGVNYSASTAPRNAEGLQSGGQTKTSITLRWKKVDDIRKYKLVVNGGTMIVSASGEEEYVTHTISNLTSGTRYNFTLFTEFENVTSSGVNYSASTAPRNAEGLQSGGQTETSITLRWKKVGDHVRYNLVVNGGTMIVSASGEEEYVTHTISNLTSGTRYNFTLFTEFENVTSSGVNYSASTVPPQVTSVEVTERSTTTVTLQWQTGNLNWSYYVGVNGVNSPPLPSKAKEVSYSIPSVTPGTLYNFTVTTVFSGLNSTPLEDFTVTALHCSWNVTSSSIQGTIGGLFSNATATNGTRPHVSPEGPSVQFVGLWPGATYQVSLVFERASRSFPQCLQNVTVLPSHLTARCEYFDRGYSVFVVWGEPLGVWTSVEVNVSGRTHPVLPNEQPHLQISGFLPARRYEVSLYLKSGQQSSGEPFVFSCLTDPRGVIAGAVFGVLTLCLLVFLAVFIFYKRADIISSEKTFIGGTREAIKKIKDISAAKFPEHFYKLSMDQGRGFSEEYESLIPVGVEQTKEAALLPQNKPKNRFTNILPYDWCRVKLSTLNPNEASDYINACYVPGYNSDRDYIATQGPLPATVKDFWRMIWEQRVTGIVMVTNCTEGGRTKCEQYWPADRKPCPHGHLSVSIRSEQKEPNWTLREFRVKHRHYSEERTVRHFHFTAWPDHGVPQGTGVLIHFRGLVRRHIETEGAAAPTVVHCSAGVGRTGTIIALDVLLQHLDRKRAVEINGFVRKMRLSRPHMVQTESQYVFLHQCIMDRLQQDEEPEEHIYENAEMIYTNATALRELTRA